MVFVSSLLVMSVLVVCLVSLISISVTNGALLSIIQLRNKFVDALNRGISVNVIYIYIFFFLLSFNTTAFAVLSILLLTYLSYSQSFVWSLAAERQILWTTIKVRRRVAQRLLNSDCTITIFTLYKYVYDMLSAEFNNFQDMIKDSVNDFKVGFGLIEPLFKISDEQFELYNMQRKIFKYNKVEPMSPEEGLETEEKVMEAFKLWKKARDPRGRFNLVSRLPWKLNYDYESNLLFKLSTRSFLVFYNFFKTTLVALTLMFVYFVYTIFFFKIQFLKQLSVWFVIGMLYFWLMSGFNFFLKRYQYGKFTSQIQRFWKRTNTYFWLIEGFLMLLFFYYYLNSSQEPIYMYDYSAVNQEYLVSLHVAGMNIILLSLVIYFMYFTMLRINSNSWTQLNLFLVVISVFVFFSFFMETYQFYYVISVFNERLWVFNEEENLWSIDIDNPILRTKHQYLLVCLIAKYWHFLFIFLSWVFFLIKSFERRKVTYVLFGVNLQNMIVLYVLNFACYLQWFKWIYRRFFDLPYTWFMTNIDNKFIFRLFFEIKLLILNLFNSNLITNTYYNILHKSLSLWNVDSLVIWKFI